MIELQHKKAANATLLFNFVITCEQLYRVHQSVVHEMTAATRKCAQVSALYRY